MIRLSRRHAGESRYPEPSMDWTPASAGATATIVEIFQSRQGEGLCVSDSHLFVRFGGCNVVCDYCDTPESIPARSGATLSLSEVLARIGTPDPVSGLHTV